MSNSTLVSMSAQTKLLGWSEAPGPWDFLLGFVVGVVAGLGATLSVAGLGERGRGD